jgi:anti-anti-sigma regulatory factor
MLNFKTNTKEKFNEIMVLEHQLTANMTANLVETLTNYLQSPQKNVILQLNDVVKIDTSIAEALVSLQTNFYENEASFVVCGVQLEVRNFLDKEQLLDFLNIAPTLSEAWDILQMEEIERELLG